MGVARDWVPSPVLGKQHRRCKGAAYSPDRSSSNLFKCPLLNWIGLWTHKSTFSTFKLTGSPFKALDSGRASD